MFKTLNLITRRLNIPLPNDIIRFIIKLLRTTRVSLKEEQSLHKKILFVINNESSNKTINIKGQEIYSNLL